MSGNTLAAESVEIEESDSESGNSSPDGTLQESQKMREDTIELAGMAESRSQNTPNALSQDHVGEEEMEDQDSNEDEYEVEEIQSHEWRKIRQKWVCYYRVKWKNYPETENTWEPEENVIEARILLADYHDKVGGQPQPPKKSKKRAAAAESPPKRQKKESTPVPESDYLSNWVPNKKDWDKEIDHIETVERDQISGELYILVAWGNGKKSKVKSKVLRQHAPGRIIDFYEDHLNFK